MRRDPLKSEPKYRNHLLATIGSTAPSCRRAASSPPSTSAHTDDLGKHIQPFANGAPNMGIGVPAFPGKSTGTGMKAGTPILQRFGPTFSIFLTIHRPESAASYKSMREL